MISYKWLLQLKKLSYKASCKRPLFIIMCVLPFSLFLFPCEKNNNLQNIRHLGERSHYHKLYSYNVRVDIANKISKSFKNDQDIYHC